MFVIKFACIHCHDTDKLHRPVLTIEGRSLW